MKSFLWYEKNSVCPDGTKHVGEPVNALISDEFVAWICIHCFNNVRPAARHLPDMWVTDVWREEPGYY